MPVNYSTTALARDGTALRCMTEKSSCMLTNLQCGQQYTVTVKAMSSTCEGNSSEPEIVNSGKFVCWPECVKQIKPRQRQKARSHSVVNVSLLLPVPLMCLFATNTVFSVPCVPADVQGMVECSTNTLQASWNKTAGAASYVSTLKGAGGFSSSCRSANQTCLFPDLQCAQTYMFSVVAMNDRCNSSESEMISAKTGKCFNYSFKFEPFIFSKLTHIGKFILVYWQSMFFVIIREYYENKYFQCNQIFLIHLFQSTYIRICSFHGIC